MERCRQEKEEEMVSEEQNRTELRIYRTQNRKEEERSKEKEDTKILKP